jgi:hypothetical protein
MGLYLTGEYPHNHDFICGIVQPYDCGMSAICIIDNLHPGRPHWGPDRDGNYHQWGLAGKVSTTERG